MTFRSVEDYTHFVKSGLDRGAGFVPLCGAISNKMSFIITAITCPKCQDIKRRERSDKAKEETGNVLD